MHSGLNPAWHFWLSTRFSCCLKMKLVENILGYIRDQFYRFSRGCKPQENLWNCSRKYTKMFKTDLFLGNKKLILNQNVWFCCIFGWYSYIEIGLKYDKIILLSSWRAFSLSTLCGQQWGYMKKELQNATKTIKLVGLLSCDWSRPTTTDVCFFLTLSCTS